MSQIRNWKGDAINSLAVAAILDAFELGARSLIMPAADEKCPIDKGTMRNTHTVQRSDASKEIVSGYGGPAAPYTLKQHEDATIRHSNGKECKWLEKAFNEHSEELLAAAIKAADVVLR